MIPERVFEWVRCYHFHLKPNTILYFKNGILLKKTATFASMLLDKKMVEKIVKEVNKTGKDPQTFGFDFKVVKYLNLPWIVPEMSYVDHFGAKGTHNIDYERDRAINPTNYLQGKRADIIKYLTQAAEMEISAD